DIECYLSFRNVEITSRGTLEVRSDCTQKEGRFFMPPAFNLGILNNYEKAKKTLDNFLSKNSINKKPSELRRLAAEGKDEELAPRDTLDTLCRNMTDIAIEGLQKRGKGEEKILKIV
ncbi:MAG: hypothetical protein IKB93_05435, partial [Clostridia bacterium]|nr:hypothetical protein [Clostridia bacterium]